MIRPSIQTRARAFTLIELLVVVAIISLLISILLPSLGKARKYARSAACVANFHGIGQAMSIYAADWNDSIMGGPTTTGSFVLGGGVNPVAAALNSDVNGKYSDTNGPNLIRTDDWMSPILAMNNGLITTAGDTTSRGQRFQQVIKTKSFICSENQLPATQFGTSLPSVTGTFLMPSYSTSTIFYWYPAGYPNGANLVTRGSAPSGGSLSPPGGYVPKVSLVGQTARKVFMGDTARYSNTTTQPDLDLTFNIADTSGVGGFGFSTAGACFLGDPGYCRDGAVGNIPSNPPPPYDPRIWAFRHGGGSKNAPPGAFKGNFLFFDGHAESMNDFAAADPTYWMPTGSQWNPNASSTYLRAEFDVKAKYLNGSTAIRTIN